MTFYVTWQGQEYRVYISEEYGKYYFSVFTKNGPIHALCAMGPYDTEEEAAKIATSLILYP